MRIAIAFPQKKKKKAGTNNKKNWLTIKWFSGFQYKKVCLRFCTASSLFFSSQPMKLITELFIFQFLGLKIFHDLFPYCSNLIHIRLFSHWIMLRVISSRLGSKRRSCAKPSYNLIVLSVEDACSYNFWEASGSVTESAWRTWNGNSQFSEILLQVARSSKNLIAGTYSKRSCAY